MACQPKLHPSQAAGLTLAGGYFREASAAAAAAPYMCKQGPEEGCKQVGDGGCADNSSRLRAAECAWSKSCDIPYLMRMSLARLASILVAASMQVRSALAEAVMLAPRLRYGSSQEVINSAMAVSDPGWRACLLVEAPPPMAEGWAVGCSM